MPNLDVQVARVPTSNLPRDRIIHTVHFKTLDPVFDADHADIAADIATLFDQTLPPITGFGSWEVKVYDEGDAMPREPRAVHTLAQRTPGSGATAREVALCLSFFADRNLPRYRGRIYMGPMTSGIGERPSSQQTGYGTALANGLAGIGGLDIQWCVKSRADGEYRQVTDFWIDDEWDTQRRRGLKATTRVAGTVSG
jgi:hypothetical protein